MAVSGTCFAEFKVWRDLTENVLYVVTMRKKGGNSALYYLDVENESKTGAVTYSKQTANKEPWCLATSCWNSWLSKPKSKVWGTGPSEEFIFSGTHLFIAWMGGDGAQDNLAQA